MAPPKKRHHMTSSSIEDSSRRHAAFFLGLPKKDEPENERPGRTSGRHQPGQRANAAPRSFSRSARRVSDAATRNRPGGTVNTAAVNLWRHPPVLRMFCFPPHFLCRRILKRPLSPARTATFGSLHPHQDGPKGTRAMLSGVIGN